MHDLVLRLPGADVDAATVVPWLLFDSHRRVERRGETPLGQLAASVADAVGKGRQRISVLVPGELVLLTEARIPTRQRNQVKKALPYMVEEQLAEPIESVHLAIPEHLAEEGGVPVAVASHPLLINWLDQLCQCQLRPERLVPDSLCVPWNPNQWSLLCLPERWLWREQAFSAQALAPQHGSLLIDWLATRKPGEGAAAPLVRVLGAADADADTENTAADTFELSAVADTLRQRLGVDVDILQYQESMLELMATTLLASPARTINLLQGGYRQSSTAAQVHPWRRIGVAAAVLLFAYSAVTLAAGAWFQHRADRLEAESIALYRELFPREQRVVSPRRQMASHLSRVGGGQGELFELLGRSAPLVQTTLAEPVMIEQLRFRGGNRELQLDVRTDSVDGLEQLRQRLSGAGLQVDLGAATERDRSASARITVRGGR